MKILNKTSWYSMKKSGNDSAEIMLYNDIGFWGITAEAFSKSLNGLGAVKNITIRINSYGGEVFDGFAIYNLLKENSAQITVIIDGVAASIASYIAMAGDTIKIPKNAFLMIHDPLMVVAGTSKDMKNAADLLDKLKEKVIDTYQTKASDLKTEDISKMMEDETWINSEDALMYGFADEVVDETENDEPVTNKGIKIPEKFKEVFLSNNKTQPAGVKTVRMNGGKKMDKCPHCNKEITTGAAFCHHCGKAVDSQTAMKIAVERERKEAMDAERKRVTDIYSACKRHNLSDEFAQELVESGEDYEKCTVKILEKIDNQDPVKPGSVVVDKDDSEKFRKHAVNSLCVTIGVEKDKTVIEDVRKNPGPVSLHTLMRKCLQRAGVDHSGMNPEQLTRESIRMAGTGSSDLPAVLEDVANKSLNAGYNEAPVTWPQWMGTMEVPDFKSVNLISMSNFSDIDDLPEGMPFKDGKLSDKKETVSIDTKGKKFTITRNALINDDLNAIQRVPRLMTGAVARRQNKDSYDLLTSASLAGPTMNEDSNTLFDTTNHSNVYADSSTPSVASIGRAQRYLMEMPSLKPEPNSTTQYMNLQGRYLVTGTANMVAIEQLLGANFDISKSIPGVPNPYSNGRIKPVFDAYLQAKLTAASKDNAWYLATAAEVLETLVMAYLQGNRVPTLQGAASSIGDALGFSWQIFFDWGIGVNDFRGIIYCDGVTA